MCSVWELNLHPFGDGMTFQPMEPPGEGSLYPSLSDQYIPKLDSVALNLLACPSGTSVLQEWTSGSVLLRGASVSRQAHRTPPQEPFRAHSVLSASIKCIREEVPQASTPASTGKHRRKALFAYQHVKSAINKAFMPLGKVKAFLKVSLRSSFRKSQRRDSGSPVVDSAVL